MSYPDLREWLRNVDTEGELERIHGADCDLEMSAIAEVLYREGKQPLPALLFDDIPGYPRGYRTLYGMWASPRRLAKSVGLSIDKFDYTSLVKGCMKQLSERRYIPPKLVNTGPVLENVLTGNKIDLTKFPSPKFHELDGGRYIGTAVAVIQRDPDNGWVNLGTYRCMVVDRDHFTVHMTEGKHGRYLIDEKYGPRNQVMPIAIAIGTEQAVYYASGRDVSWNVSEYDFAGGIMGEPVEVIEGPYTKLPLPAHAEIVIEGEWLPGEMANEGPFGEWAGYYANLGRLPVPEPVIRVKTILHRNDPIITCMPPSAPPNEQSLFHGAFGSAEIWSKLELCNVPGIKGVWNHAVGSGILFNVISIKQSFVGHPMQAGLIASQLVTLTHTGAFTVVVDDDINPYDLYDVMWAVATRTDPERDIHIIPRCFAGSSDPCVPLEEKMKYPKPPKPLSKGRAVIDACRPYAGKENWYPVARISSGLRQQVLDKWDTVFKRLL